MVRVLALCAASIGLLSCGGDPPDADIQCPIGRMDCDEDSSNGCEIDVIERCGGVVGTTEVTYSCLPAGCEYDACLPDRFECDGDVMNGCEVDGIVACDGIANATNVAFDCFGCSFDCLAGFRDCDAQPNGCELDVAATCAGVQNATGVDFDCESAACTYDACDPGYFDCSGAGDGCEYQGTGCPIQLTAMGGYALAVDDTAAYWTDDADHYDASAVGVVRSVPLGGGAVTTLATGHGAGGVALDATHVYFARTTLGDGGVRRVLKTGGTVETVVGDDAPSHWVAVDASNAYFSDFGTAYRVPKGGGTAVAIGSGTYGVAVDATNVYTAHGFAVWQLPIAGGPGIQLDAADPSTAAGGAIAVDATHVYWTTSNEGLQRAPIGGGVVPTMIAPSCERWALAVDATHVYWSDGSHINAAPTLGGPTVVVASFTSAAAIATAGSNVYWANGSGIWTAPKPPAP